MDALLHQALAGLATGGIYASLALALVMIYHATHLVNFAQGEMAMFTTYIAWSLINAGMPYWPAFLLTVGIAFILGIFIERIVIRPVENAPVLGVVVVFIGLLVILNSVAGWIYSYTIKSFPSPFPRPPILGIHYHSAHALRADGGDARGSAEPRVEPPGRHPRRLDARAWLGPRRRGRRGRGHDGRAHRLPGSEHDGRDPALRVRRGAAWRHRQPGRRGARRLRRRRAGERARRVRHRQRAEARRGAPAHRRRGCGEAFRLFRAGVRPGP